MTDSRAKYEQLIDDLRADLRPQRQWGEGRGVFLVVGHFVVGIAAGAWFIALGLGFRAGLAAAFALAALGGVAHLAFLGRPERFWRMVARLRSSWISRGFLGLSLFLVGAFLYLAPMFLADSPWPAKSPLALAGYWLAIAGAALLIVYMGFVYTASKAIPFWNSPLHPALYVAYALRGGIAAVLVAAALTGQHLESAPTLVAAWLGVTAVAVLLFVLEIHGAATSGNAAARRSVRELFAGRTSVHFYVGTLAVGLIVPAALAIAGLSAPLTIHTMAAIGVASAAGDFFVKYSTIRAGVHLPLWHSAPARR